MKQGSNSILRNLISWLLQQPSTSGTRSDKAPVYDSDGSAEVHHSENCYDNDIFNMFTQEEQYTELLKPIPEPHQVQQNDSNVISTVSSLEQSGRTVEQHPVNVDETRVLYDSLYNNLAIEVEKVNSVNRKLRETNADLTSELARYKNQEKCFEINQEKYNKLERSSCLSNKLEKIEETHRSLQSSNYPDHTSSEYNNIKLAIRNEKYEYVNGMKYTKKNQSANVSNVENEKKHKLKVKKPKKVRSKERLASPKPSTPRSCLRWSPTGRIFDINGKTIATGEPVCQSDCSKGDNASTSNPQEPINKRFPSSTFSMTRCQNWLDTLLIPLLSEYKPKDKEHHGDNECDI
ncbi:hypothetical protein Tco_0965665 [Tanacetum coccineum]